MSNIHCCVTNKCTGSKYNNWYFECKFCKNPVFVQCMRNRDAEVKTVLLAFGLARINSKNEYVLLDDSKSVSTLMACFKTDSAFSITCELCSDKFKKIIDVQNAGPPPEQKKTLQQIKNREQMNTANIITTSPEVNITTQNSTHISDCLEIFVSSFPSKTECDAITAQILSKSSLQADNFEVSKMVGPNVNLKYRKFMSFKIKVLDKKTYDIIISDNIWAPFAKAVPFNANAKAESRQRKLQNQNKVKQNNQNKNKNQSDPQKLPSKQQNQGKQKPAVVMDDARGKSNNKQHENQQTKSHKMPHEPKNKPNDRRPVQQMPPMRKSFQNSSHCSCFQKKDEHLMNENRRNIDENFHWGHQMDHRPRENDLSLILRLLQRMLENY